MQRKPLTVVVALVVLVTAQSSRTPLVTAQQKEHCGTITSNETWTPAANPHLVKCTVIVQNSVLTLAPATTVLMAAGTSIIIKPGASLQAVGDPMVGDIRIMGNSGADSPGFWGQILFEAGAAASKLNRAVVRDGGKDNVPMVEIQDALVEIDNVQLHLAAAEPLGYWANAVGPSLEAPGQATVGVDCPNSPHPQVQLDRHASILVTGGEHHVVDAQTWHNFCAPYRIQGDLVVAGPQTPVLGLDEGATLQFDGDAGLVVGAAGAPGQLETSGSPDSPVVLTGQTPTPGSWRGVDLTEFSGANSLITTRVEYGGRGGRPMVQVRSIDSTGIDVAFNHAEGYPLSVVSDGVGGFTSGLANGTTAAFTDNGIQRILVITNPTGASISYPATEWSDPGVAYELDGSLTIASQGRAARLTLLPGVRLMFRPDQALIVGDATLGAGSLIAKGGIDGNAERPVVLSGLEVKPGAWRGLVVTDKADVVQLDRTLVTSAGDPMVLWGNAAGSITRTTFSGGPGYPIVIPLSRAPDVIMGSSQLDPSDDMRNHVAGNGTDRILVHVDGPLTNARLKDWADPGAPVELDASVTAASPAGTRLMLHDGLDLRFRPGTAFQLSLPNQKGSIDVADENPDLPVRFGPVDATSGWGGLNVASGGFLRGAGLELAGAPQGVANLLVDGATVNLDGLVVTGDKRGIGIDARNAAKLTLTGARFENLEIGIRTAKGSALDITKSVVQGNSAWGIQNTDPTVCQRALQVWWGDRHGPQDDSDARDGCMNAKNVSPGADKVSDDVEWWPYAVNDTDFAPAQGIGPNARMIFLPYAIRP
jgi:hypothetical protein